MPEDIPCGWHIGHIDQSARSPRGHALGALASLGAARRGKRSTRPLEHLVGLVQQSLRHLPVGADFDAPALRLVAERLEALCHVGWTVAVVHLEVEGVAQDEREDQAIAIDAGPAEHAPRADRAEATQ